MSQENITFDLEIGTVQNPSSFVRLNVQSDQNEKGRIASICGCHPETGSIVVRVSNQATEEVLDPVFQALTESTYAELQSQGKVQEFPEGSHKWIKVPLDIVAGGMLSEQVVPMLSGNENLSGNLQVVIESDADGYSLAPFKAEGRSILYGVFKSFRINASTNFSKDQLQAISELVSGILGIPMEKYSSFFSSRVSARIVFDSWEDVPAELTADLLDIKQTPLEKKLNKLINTPFALVGEGFEAHVFLTDSISAKVEVNCPGLSELKA